MSLTRLLTCTPLVLLLVATAASAQAPLVCDANTDGVIDRLDIDLITAARNQSASGPTDPRDPDRDKRITVVDARTCTLRCTLANCAIATNRPPAASAGPAQTVALAYGPSPSAYADLVGSASDDGFPNPPARLTLAWSKVSGPGAVAFAAPGAAATRVFLEKAGSYVLRLSASDGAAKTDSDVTITVTTPPPTVPKLKPIADRTIMLGQRFDIALAVDEPNAFDALSYSLLAAPTGARLNPAPLLEWTPDPAQLGSHVFTVKVANASGANDSTTFRVTVVNANRPPALDAQPDATAFAGAPFARLLNATDPDPGDAIAYALVSGPAGMSLTGTRNLQWTPAANQLGEHFVTVRASDAAGAAAFARFAVTVRNAAAPVARDDRYTVPIGTTLVVGGPGVLANDADPNGGALSAERRSDPDKGTLAAFAGNGGFTYQAPAALPPRPPLQATLGWHADVKQFSYAMAIGDLDGDGIADIVHLAYNNRVHALRGSNGSALWTLASLPAPYANCTPFLGDDNVPVIADIDDDGAADIVLHVGCNNDSPNPGSLGHVRVMALNGRDGTVKWLSPRLIAYDAATQAPPREITTATTLAVARLAPGETPSILGGHTIEDFLTSNACAHLPGGVAADKRCRYVFALNGRDGTLRRSFYSTPSDQALPSMGYDRPGTNGVGRFESPIVLDFDGDGTLEVLYEGSLWSAAGALLRQFDGQRTRPNGSRAAAADLDGDGRIDVLLLDQRLARLRAFAIDGALLWDVPLNACNMVIAYCAVSVADVDADGQPDVLVAGRDRLIVLDRFGHVRWASVDPDLSVEARLGCDNRPAVYDLDGDGAPEVILRNAYIIRFLRGTTGEEITRFSFGPARSGYLCAMPQDVRIADVDGDGHAEVVFNAPDDGISGLDFGGVWVLKSANDPWMPARSLFNQWAYLPTAIGDDLRIPQNYVRPNAAPATNLFAQQEQLATRADLRTREHTSFTYASLAQGLASNVATVALDLVPPNRPPAITSIPPAAGTTTNFAYQLTATDPDPNDALVWSLTYADFLSFDTAASIDPATGLLTESKSNPASYLFIVRVTDSQGGFAEQAIAVDLTNATTTVPPVLGLSETAARHRSRQQSGRYRRHAVDRHRHATRSARRPAARPWCRAVRRAAHAVEGTGAAPRSERTRPFRRERSDAADGCRLQRRHDVVRVQRGGSARRDHLAVGHAREPCRARRGGRRPLRWNRARAAFEPRLHDGGRTDRLHGDRDQSRRHACRAAAARILDCGHRRAVRGAAAEHRRGAAHLRCKHARRVPADRGRCCNGPHRDGRFRRRAASERWCRPDARLRRPDRNAARRVDPAPCRGCGRRRRERRGRARTGHRRGQPVAQPRSRFVASRGTDGAGDRLPAVGRGARRRRRRCRPRRRHQPAAPARDRAVAACVDRGSARTGHDTRATQRARRRVHREGALSRRPAARASTGRRARPRNTRCSRRSIRT